MPERKRIFPSKLAKAHEQLQKAQAHVAALEAQLFEDQSHLVVPQSIQDRYHYTLDNMLEGCQIIGFDWRYLYVNDTAAQHGQQKKVEMLGFTMMERYPGIEKTEMFDVLQHCMQERIIEHLENKFSYPDGTTAWFELRIQPVPDGIVIFSLDITERKRTETAEHEQRLLAETLRDSLALLTTSLDVETVMQQILAYSAMVIPSEAGTIILFEGDHGRVAYSRGYSAEAEAFFKTNSVELDSGVYGRSKDDSTFYLAADTHSTPDWTDFPFTNWVRSSIGVQIVAQGKVIGLLIADSATPNRFQHKDVENLQAFARYAALALENAYHVDQLEDKVEKRTADLQEAKERVEAILNNSPDGILLVDTDLNIQQVNASFNRIFSCQPDDYYGKSLVDLIHAEDTHSVKDSIQTVVVERQGKHIEIRASRKDGTVFDAELSIGLIRDNGLVCIIRNISERKRLNRQLQYHASLQENVSDAVVVTDMEFRIQSWNKAATRIYGWTAEEALGKVAPELLQIRFPPVMDRETGLKEFNEHGSLQQETIQRRKDGTDIFILGSATRLEDEKGVAIGVIAVNRDITERKAQERQLRYHASLQESMRDAVFVMDMQFTIQSWNKAAELIYGWTAEEAIGTHADTILRNQISEEENHRLFAQLIEQSWLKFDLIQLHKEGDPLNIWCSMTLIKDIDGHPVGILSVNHDITERKSQERQIRYYASFQEHISDAVIATDTEFHIQSWNKAAERIYGWTAGEVIGKTVRDVLHTQLPKGVSREIAKQELADSHEWHNEVRQKHKNGNWLDISASVSHLTDENGALIGEVAVNRDITERKAQERQLQYHASLQSSVSDAVIATDMDFIIRSWNHAAETVYGWSAVETIGKPVNEILHTAYESEADRARILQDFLERGAWQGEVIQHHRDGSPINILASVNLFKDETGQPFGIVSVNRDITERKRVTEALQKSAAEIHDLYNKAPCGYHSIDKNGLIVQINDTELQWLGYTRDEVIDRLKITDIFTQESVDIFRKAFPAFMERGWVNDLEFDVLRKDGSIMHILLNATAIYDEHGQFLRSRSTLFDITKLKRAEDKLKERMEENRQFQSHLKALHEITIELTQIDDLDAFYKDVVRFGIERLGFERLALFLYHAQDGTAQGTYGTDASGNLMDERHIRFKPNPTGIMFRSFNQAERFYFDEQVMLYENQEPVGTGWNAAAVIWSGTQSLGWFVADNLLSRSPASKSTLDILALYAMTVGTLLTQKQIQIALRESEEKFRMLVEAAPLAVVITNQKGEIVLVNAQAEDVFGYQRNTMLGQPIELLVPEHMHDQHVRFRNEYMAAPSLRSMGGGLELQARRQNNSLFPAEVELSYIQTHNNFLVMSFVIDITERKNAEVALRQALAKEKELGELKSRFVSMASHEFRTPLASILALTETLSAYRHQLSDDQIDEKFSKIKDQIGHLKNIMEDVLLLARMQSRRVEFKPVKVDIDALCRSVLDEFQSRPEVRHQLDYSCGDGIHEVELDRKLMRQIISNLVANAIKYSPAAKPIQISLECVDEVFVLTVRDKGIGIPDADLKHLFEAFHRAANVGAISGTGLGLVITKEAVELHGGSITVDSQVDMGTTFTVRIPVSRTGENEK